ncbi:zwei Ig domain protein zig-2-like [Haliotis cracherodii]|uniref:zwei Ig domain protein zig-2-like n=1 Tax=Haliotis cracherodii TaxID=6455 RepID=UPI0039E7D5AC
MTSLKRLLMLAVSVALFSCVSSAFLKSLKHKSLLNRKHNSAVSKRQEPDDSGPKLFFKGRPLRPTTRVTRRHETVLECEAGGSPGPSIHWLKDGERIEQGMFENYQDDEASFEDTIGKDGLPLLRLSTTRSKLHIDCISPKTEGQYTCVAETPYDRISQSTTVKVISRAIGSFDECLLKKSIKGEKAQVYMWTATRVEFEENRVQLFCRASGSPAPRLTWYDAEGEPIQPGHKYEIAENGDLIIKNINWFDMGVYTCTASNKHGEDSAESFLYPTYRDDEEEMLPPV